MPALQRVAGYQRANGVAGGAIAVAAPCAPGKDRDDLATTPAAPGPAEIVRVGALPIR